MAKQEIINIKCACCGKNASYNVIRGDVTTHMCYFHAKEMERDFRATIQPIENEKTRGRRWVF